MARTGRSRVLGSSAAVFLKADDGNLCPIGEVDKFTAKEVGELKKSRPLGKKQFASQYDHQGWELSFEGGKVDWKLAALIQAQNVQFQNGGRTPYFMVTQRVLFYDGSIEEYQYNDVTIHNYNFDEGGSGDELQEKFEAYSASRTAVESTQAAFATADAFKVVKASLAKMLSQRPSDNGALQDATSGPKGDVDS